MSKSASQVIMLFTQATQEMEINASKLKYEQLNKELKQRRQDLMMLNKGKQKVVKADASKSEKFKTMDEHKLSIPDFEKKLETNCKTGLTEQKAAENMGIFGKNMLTEKLKIPWYVSLCKELTSMFALLMWGASVLCIIAFILSIPDYSNLWLAIVLAFVVSATSIMTWLQNSKSQALMDAFKNFIPPETLVIRNGVQSKVAAADLVPGDLVVIEFGKRIPADVRIVESNGMKVDNSSLTGESLLLLRTTECSHPDNPLETKNLAFFGTLCKEGNGKGVVVFTGDNTVIGQIAGLAADSGQDETPLRRELNAFVHIIAGVAITIGVIFFCLGFAVGYNALTNIQFALGIIVGFVPEGLLATVNVALSLTARKLATRKVLVKNLEGVETLGSTSCICSDKTGTLTQNKMTVAHLWYNGKMCVGHNRQKFGTDFKYEYDLNDLGFQELFECASICSEAIFDSTLPQEQVIKIQSNESWSDATKKAKLEEAQRNWNEEYHRMPWLDRPVIGDASETALIKFLQPIKDIIETRNSRKLALDKDQKPAKMPFNSTNKYAFLIIEYETPDSHYCLLTKGAPERIWGLCEYAQLSGRQERKSEQWDKSFDRVNQIFGKNGERVLGFSKCHLPKSEFPKGFAFNLDRMNFPFDQQSFIGAISLVDPPKDAVPNAVLKCKTAGIQVIMVTGDQPVTAAAIAKQCNIITEKTVNEIAEEEGISFEDAFNRSNAIVIHGDKLTRMAIDDEGKPESEKGRPLNEWLSKNQIVFARTSPAQKLIIVDGCQKRGHLVAVTGDGVNDSPAIKKADIGISMGITGSDVAKDAADMILLNDDFSNIVIGIEEGRKIFDNLKKTIALVLVGDVTECIAFLAFIILQIPVPITFVYCLCIDLGIGLVPSTSFVYEDAEVDIMTRRPRNQQEHLVSPKLIFFAYAQVGAIESFGCFLSYVIVFNDFGFPPYTLPFLINKAGIAPLDSDQFDPSSPFLGNSNLRNNYETNSVANPKAYPPGVFCTADDSTGDTVDWVTGDNQRQDLRMFLVVCNTDTGRWEQRVTWGTCNVDQVSPISGRPICYTSEAIGYAQTSYFFSIAIIQIGNYVSFKTNKTFGLYQPQNNIMFYFGLYTQVLLLMLIAYCEPVARAFGSRDVIFQHFCVPAMPFAILVQVWNELRKYMARNSVSSIPGLPNWWYRCTMF